MNSKTMQLMVERLQKAKREGKTLMIRRCKSAIRQYTIYQKLHKRVIAGFLECKKLSDNSEIVKAVRRLKRQLKRLDTIRPMAYAKWTAIIDLDIALKESEIEQGKADWSGLE